MFRKSIVIRALAFSALFLLSSLPVIGSNPDDEVEKQLAGKVAREWVFKKFDMYMSASKKCKQGESYRFKADHTVTISRCIDGEEQSETLPWSIESDPLEIRVKLGSDSYILKFWKTSKGQFMLLRTKGITKVDPTVDKTLQLAEQ